jgi:hypothetical protein
VVSDCVSRGTVDVILNNNTKVVGTLAAWDPDNDVAGIYVTNFVPPLLWQGESPVQGGWVGVIGSPKGLPGVLTTGIISSVSTVEKYVTFTAPINPGNSGGPVFDSVGRVMAIATAKVRDSEGFAIGNGVPLICEVVVKCSSSLQGWGSKAPAPTPTPTPTATIAKLAQDIFVPEFDDVYLSKGSIVYIPFVTSYLPLSIRSLDSSVCDYVLNYIKLKKPGRCTITLDQSGSAFYAPAESKIIDFEVLATKKTITCIKGKSVKKVTALNPKCPVGFKKK